MKALEQKLRDYICQCGAVHGPDTRHSLQTGLELTLKSLSEGNQSRKVMGGDTQHDTHAITHSALITAALVVKLRAAT